jgi:hypothetical protein
MIITVTIREVESVKWTRMLRALVFIAAVMLPGIVLHSVAMQWLAFVICCVVAVGFAASHVAQRTALTPEQAIAYLEKQNK